MLETYIAMLRGINVSGQKKIKMADLKDHMQDIGFKNVQTYIQSGNIVFEYEKALPEELKNMIEEMLYNKYHFKVSVIIKSPGELDGVIKNNPFSDTDRTYITFLSEKPHPENVEKIKAIDHKPEEFILDGNIIYFYSPKGYGRAIMNNNFFENKLKVDATTRNWKTVNKLIELTERN